MLSRGVYFILASRKMGDSASVKTMTSSPVIVLMSCCRLTGLTPVTPGIMAFKSGREVSINWVRTGDSGVRTRFFVCQTR
jgi:hypothetical protein